MPRFGGVRGLDLGLGEAEAPVPVLVERLHRQATGIGGRLAAFLSLA